MRFKMKLHNYQKVFFALLKAGLWEKKVRLSPYKDICFSEVYRIAEEQSVIGLVAAGLEHISDVKVPQQWALQLAGQTLQLEKRNLAMNEFVAKLIGHLREEGVYCVLVKGQGVAQCYERPLWRSSGDVDLLLSDENYKKAQFYLDKIADSFNVGTLKEQNNHHREYHIKDWVVELHGTLNSNLSDRIDIVVSSARDQVFFGGDVRVWDNGKTPVYLPSPNVDVIFVFVHILQHFFNGGIGLRQVCDWCRLIWCYHDQIDTALLEKRLNKMGLLTEWKAFASLAVNYLGMPSEAMPYYDLSQKWLRKAKRIISYILFTGNFGHNKDFSYTTKHGVLVRKSISFYLQAKDSIVLGAIFPLDTMRFFARFMRDGLNGIIKRH